MSGDSSHGPDLDRALSLYREARSPTDATHERVWSAVDANVNAPAGGDSGAPSTPHGAGVGGKLAALVGVAAVGAAVWWMANAGAPAVEPQRAPNQEPAAAPTATVATPAPTNQPSVQPTTPPVEDPLADELAAPAPAPTNEPVAVAPAPRPSQATRPASTLAEELRLMTAAQAALDANEPQRALRLLERHRRRHANGALTEEREAARVEALCGVGRAAAARRAAEHFATSFAGSPRIARVSSLCTEAAP